MAAKKEKCNRKSWGYIGDKVFKDMMIIENETTHTTNLTRFD